MINPIILNSLMGIFERNRRIIRNEAMRIKITSLNSKTYLLLPHALTAKPTCVILITPFYYHVTLDQY